MPLAYLSKSEAKKFGLPKKNIQTILFNKDVLSLKESRDWLKKHGYLYQNYRIEGNHRRFQQNNPIIGATYYSKKLKTGKQVGISEEIPDITMIFQTY